ncbi:DoxX family protein [Botrimarina mediterranea]|uniref:DoxX family protein n=1 Tax=Botrimarina mediterranea TaxID=2528022 RepID=UPI00118CE7A1|nr:Putative oxidoreductase CatD [Planctomycetes bacterium K2D]
MLLQPLLRTSAPASVLLIRLMVGFVFFSEGLQKFLYPASRGAGRFEKIGLPSPEALSYFVASFEVACGVLLMLGLLTRLASLPTIAIMLVAIVTTKLPVLADAGFWQMAHDARTDWSMLLGSIFLFIVGAGPLSMDAKLTAPDPPDARKEDA